MGGNSHRGPLALCLQSIQELRHDTGAAGQPLLLLRGGETRGSLARHVAGTEMRGTPDVQGCSFIQLLQRQWDPYGQL